MARCCRVTNSFVSMALRFSTRVIRTDGTLYLILILCGSAISASAQISPLELGLSSEIWISLRTDNEPGEGTFGSPFNGSGDGLDSKLRELSVVGNATN